MGKNSGHSWLEAVKKAFRSPSNDDEKRRSSRRRDENEPEEEEKKRGKKRWSFRRHFSVETTIQHNVANCATASAVRICSGEENLVRKQPKMEIPASEQRRAFEVAMATTVAAEAAVATAQAAVEIIRLTRPSLLVKQDQAAVVIQKIFRGYLARRALMALKGVVKLQALIRGHNVRKRAKMTLQCIQSLVRVQALVCDQRRRLSCEATTLATMFSHDNTLRNSISRNINMSRISGSLDVDPSELEEIHALIQKAKECSLKQSKTLAHAFSQQLSHSEEQYLGGKRWFRKDRNLCNSIKTVEVDTSSPYSFTPPPSINLSLQSPRTPSSSKSKSIQAAETPTSRSLHIHRMSMSENSCPLPRPNYMAATASAIARVRPSSTPRQRLSSPSREQPTGSARKRLSFPVHDAINADDKANFLRCRGTQFGEQQRLDKPYYATD